MIVMNAPAITETIPIIKDNDGVIRIARTRVTLDTVVNAFQEGATAEEIAQQYPAVSLADIYSLIGYYLRRRLEIETYLAQQRQVGEAGHVSNPKGDARRSAENAAPMVNGALAVRFLNAALTMTPDSGARPAA